MLRRPPRSTPASATASTSPSSSAARRAALGEAAMAGPQYVMTVRHGARVERHGFDELGEAVATLREEAESIRVRSRVPPATTLVGEFDPEQIVAARLEI